MASLKPYPVINLSGVWVMDKDQSTNLDSLMKLQGISWLLRQATQRISITVTITEHASIAADGSPLALHLDVVNTTTGGFSGTTEKRTLDWEPRVHNDYALGTLSVRSRMIGGVKDESGQFRPELEMYTRNVGERVLPFLRGEVSSKGEREEGFLVEGPLGEDEGNNQGRWMHTVSHNEEKGWTMEQVWGLEMIQGERYHTRRAVVFSKSGDYVLAHVVYKLQG